MMDDLDLGRRERKATRILISPGYADSGCLAFTSSGTPCGTSTFPACPDCKSRRSPAGPENKANPCCPCSIVSPRASGLAHLPCHFFRSYRDSERGTWATRSRWLCALRAPTFSGVAARSPRRQIPRPVLRSGLKPDFEESLSSLRLGVAVGPRTRAHVLLRNRDIDSVSRFISAFALRSVFPSLITRPTFDDPILARAATSPAVCR